ncbi:MAG: dienelactone hydrolase [Gemmatimonadetes bacterium]|nr:dienelactone hydrolase [Gemmatimonadota bacterium]
MAQGSGACRKRDCREEVRRGKNRIKIPGSLRRSVVLSFREEAFHLTNEIDLSIRCDLSLPKGEGPFPVVVLLHGFKGFKDWGMFPHTAQALAARGIAVLRMNTSMNGVEEELEEFTRLDLFAKNTPSREVADVRLVLDALESGSAAEAAGCPGMVDASRIGIVGHSKGGGVALLVAGGDPRVQCVVTWAAIASFYRWSDRAVEKWREDGRIDIPNARTGQMMWLDASVLEDGERNREAYDIEAACRRTTAPGLVIHGEVDESVEVRDSARIFDWLGSAAKERLVIPHTGHTFGAVHPWAGATPAWEQAVAKSGDWFLANL